MWDSLKEASEKRRFIAEGLNKRPPVVAAAVFFLVMWLSGWGSSAGLLALGMKSIPARYAIATLVSYGIFIWSVGVWCRYVAASPRNSDSVLDGIDIPIDGGDGEGCLVVVAVFAVALLFSAVFYLVGGYAMLFEVAFEVAFAGTMVSRMGKPDMLGNWTGTLVKRTWLPALIIGGILVGFGAKMQHDYPEALTMAKAIKAYRSGQD